MQNYFYKKRIKKLQKRLDIFKSEPNDYYRAEKLVQTKRGVPVYLIHCTYSEDGQEYSGCIYVLTTKGFDGALSYTIEPSGQSIIIRGINHKIKNKGIGTQLLIYLDEIARGTGDNKITGWLSPIDLETHGKRLIHFYERNGYQVAEGKVPNLNIDGLIVTKYL
jgi:GNAT superfamily N-acetyltransferase